MVEFGRQPESAVTAASVQGTPGPEVILSVDDLPIQYPLPGLDSRPFESNPQANFAFSDEAADAIARLPHYGDSVSDTNNTLWRRSTEGPDRLPQLPPVYLPRISQATQDRVKAQVRAAWESPRTRTLVRVTGIAVIAGGALAGAASILNPGHLFAQDHASDGHNGHNGNNMPDAGHAFGPNHHDSAVDGSQADSHVATVHGNPYLGEYTNVALNGAVVQQLSFFDSADGQSAPQDIDQDSSPDPEIDPSNGGKTLFFPRADTDADHPPVITTPTPPPTLVPPDADIAFTDGEGGGSARAAAAPQAYRGQNGLTLEFKHVVNNDTTDTAESVVARLDLPEGVILDETNPDSAGCEVVVSPDADVECIVDDGTLAPGEQPEDNFDVGVNVTDYAPLGELIATAELRAERPVDPNLANNTDSVVVSVIEPTINIGEGNAFTAPDTTGFHHDVAEGPYVHLGSMLGPNGRFDGIRVTQPKTGKVVCEFVSADAGIMVFGDRLQTLDPSCQRQIFTTSRIPIPDNQSIPYTEGGVDHPLWVSAPEVSGDIETSMPFTDTVRADILNTHDAGVFMRRGNEIDGPSGPLTSRETILITNNDGRMKLQIFDGVKPWTQGIEDRSVLRYIEDDDLGAAQAVMQLRVEKPGGDHDQLFIDLGEGEERTTKGPYPIMKVRSTDQNPTLFTGLQVPVGTGFGEALIERSRPVDGVMTATELRDLDNRTVDNLIDPETGETWGTIRHIWTHEISSGQLFFPDDIAVLGHHGHEVAVDNEHPGVQAEFMDMLPQSSEGITDFLNKHDLNRSARLTPSLDNQAYVNIFGRSERLSPSDINPDATIAVLRDKVRNELVTMLDTQENGRTPVFRIEGFHHTNFIDNPFLYVQAGPRGTWRVVGLTARTADTPGSYDKLISLINDIKHNIAASEFPTLRLEGSGTSATLPTLSGQTMIELGDLVNASAIADFAQDHPEITEPVLTDNAPNRRFGGLGEAKTAELANYWTKVIEAVKAVRPDVKSIGVSGIANAGHTENPTDRSSQGAYYDQLATAGLQAYRATGVRINFAFQLNSGVQQRSLFAGPAHPNPEQPWGLKADDISQPALNTFASLRR